MKRQDFLDNLIDESEHGVDDRDALFAIARALFELVDGQEKLCVAINRLGFDGPMNEPGALEKIAMELTDIRKLLEDEARQRDN